MLAGVYMSVLQTRKNKAPAAGQMLVLVAAAVLLLSGCTKPAQPPAASAVIPPSEAQVASISTLVQVAFDGNTGDNLCISYNQPGQTCVISGRPPDGSNASSDYVNPGTTDVIHGDLNVTWAPSQPADAKLVATVLTYTDCPKCEIGSRIASYTGPSPLHVTIGGVPLHGKDHLVVLVNVSPQDLAGNNVTAAVGQPFHLSGTLVYAS
jgi:hypothetical protein